MQVELVAAIPEDEARLAALLQLYDHELAQLLGLDLGEDGRYRPPPVDFAHPRRHHFLLRADGKLAGFALVEQTSRLTGDQRVWDLAEFFVLPRYRRHGVGEAAARLLFARLVGPWEVRQRRENVAATAFWRRVLGRLGPFEELALDDARWRGPVQRFVSGA